MEILDLTIQLDATKTQTNFKIPFKVPQSAEKLVIHFHYSPNQSRDDVAIAQLERAISKYALAGYSTEQLQVEYYLPVDNLITLSLTKNGQYLGAHHNKSNNQTIIISQETASHGFWPIIIESAQWELQLNCHCIASHMVQANVRIEVQ